MVIIINGQLSKDVNMKKLSFNIITFNIVTHKIDLRKVNGYQIDSYAAVYREYPRWVVIELNSGTSICAGKTKQAAVEDYHQEWIKTKIAWAHTTKMYKLLKYEFEKLTKGQNENDNK